MQSHHNFGGEKVAADQNSSLWIHCPICGSKTRAKVCADTVLVHFPLYCPKCKQERLIDVEELKVTVINMQVK